MQNNFIAATNSIVTEVIKQEIGNSRYTIRVDGNKDPTGEENIFIINCFLNEHFLKVAERLLVMRNQVLT